jgi:hypothetical protein
VLGGIFSFVYDNISFVFLFVCPLMCPSLWNNSARTGRTSIISYIWIFFSKICRQNSSFLKYNKNDRYVTWRPKYTYDRISLNSSYRRNISDRFSSRIETNFMLINSFSQSHALLWDKMEKLCTAGQGIYDNITRRMRFVCWTTKARNTHPEYVILTAFSTTKIVTRTRLNVTFTVQSIACLII